ncbi:MAG: A/G-specific adenine glycosylase [Armatimonadota bacterium]|nr:A/G-specific adenine glycosylase [Armatimonadota bacterium]MDR7507822.1 A/G-specific adenine glycosylase [Armatimonadota bacterium]MDR7510145.1 A/G-specific adenine glycosylase [Armatimonadota bacterium]
MTTDRSRPQSARARQFVRRLLRWYARRGRDLPWRRTRDPYRILVSEIMLQQTPVARVLPKYREWLRRYPTWQTLARATARDVREAWYPLGYNARPVRLRNIARIVVRRYGGRLPASRDALLRLDGIGPATAGALLTFAFGGAEPIVDTNVRRVLTRAFYGGRAVPERALWDLAADLVRRADAYDLNQALMDLGAMVCRARRPRCPDCPVRAACAACGRADLRASGSR